MLHLVCILTPFYNRVVWLPEFMVILYSDFTPMAIRSYSRKSYRRGKVARRSRKYRRFGRRRSTYGISTASNRYSRETSVFSTSLSSYPLSFLIPYRYVLRG